MILAKSQKNNFLREYFVFGVKPLTLKNFPACYAVLALLIMKGAKLELLI